MLCENFAIRKKTEGYCDIHNITEDAKKILLKSKVVNGQLTFFVVGSTAGITSVEYEPGLVEDLKKFFEKWVPQDDYYHHEEAWHDGNGFSHVRASLLKPSLTVPIISGQMVLGTWQQVVLIDFDNRPRTREVVVQIMGCEES